MLQKNYATYNVFHSQQMDIRLFKKNCIKYTAYFEMNTCHGPGQTRKINKSLFPAKI
jgi:hypothetical protein